MIIWFALIIPIVTAVIMAALFRHKIAWWEYGLPLVVSILLIGTCKGCAEVVQTRDTEYWGGYITRATYYEDWNERVSCRHPKYRTETRTRVVTDSKGNSQTESYTVQVFDGYHHLYDVDYHPEHWIAETSNGGELSISSDTWRYYTEVFKNRTFRDLNRDYHDNDGDAYDTEWNQQFETVQPVVTTHIYENRVQASNSVFNYKELTDKEKKGLINYVYEGPLQTPSVLPEGLPGADHVDKMNALLGRKHQIRVWVLIFRNQQREIAKRQEALWKGGNKNELVICVGLNNTNTIQWAEVFSWTKREDLKVSVRNYIEDQKNLDLIKLTPWLTKEIQSKWERRQFKEFSYLTVEPPMWLVALVFVLTLLVSVGIAIFAIFNEFDGDGFSDASTDGIQASLVACIRNIKTKQYLRKIKMRLRR